MCQVVREKTPIEVLEKDLMAIVSRPLNENAPRIDELKEAIAKAKCYEHEFYNCQWEAKRAQVKDLERKNKVLETQNRVLTEYIINTEEYGGKSCL